MKHIFVVLVVALATTSLKSQEEKTWRLGVQWGFQGNKSNYSGGMKNADGRFHENKNADGALDFILRYDFNTH